MKWNIVTDSSCDLLPAEEPGGEVQVFSVPFVISVGDADFVDDAQMDTAAMLEAIEQCPEASYTSCPAPQSWIMQFEKAHQSIAITISSKLSGSMNSAITAREMVLERYPNKKIAILDSRSTGPELVLCVDEIKRLIASGADFDKVVSQATAFLEKAKVIFALCSFDNLVKNGRMSRTTGFIARKLGMWGIGVGSEEGAIAVTGKTRGSARAVSKLLEHMKESGFRGGRVAISHCHNSALAAVLKRRIQELWTGCEVQILPTRGLCSYYAERGGLIMSYFNPATE